MARDDSWAQVLRAGLPPILDEARPSGMLGWVRPVAPVATQAAVGAGHWAAGRRRRALAAWTSAAGYGLVAWGLGTEAPTPAEVRENMEQNIQRLQREGVLPEPGPKAPAAARTPTPAARRLERHLSRAAPFFRAMDTPLYRLASTVVGMVIGVWWGLRWPRRLTVLAIAVEAPNAVIHVPWVARAVQRRRPRIAAGWALVAAGSVARLRAASAEPLRLQQARSGHPGRRTPENWGVQQWGTATRTRYGHLGQPTTPMSAWPFCCEQVRAGSYGLDVYDRRAVSPGVLL
jgi:hypothetical protein